MFNTEYRFPILPKCKKHPTYKVMRQPTADCKHCRELWKERLDDLICR